MTTARIMRQRLFEVRDQDAPMTMQHLIEIGEFGEGDVNDFIKAEKRRIERADELLINTIEKEARKIIRAEEIEEETGIPRGAWEKGMERIIEIASRAGTIDTAEADLLAEKLDSKIEELRERCERCGAVLEPEEAKVCQGCINAIQTRYAKLTKEK